MGPLNALGWSRNEVTGEWTLTPWDANKTAPTREGGRCANCDGWHRERDCPDHRAERIAQERDDADHKRGW